MPLRMEHDVEVLVQREVHRHAELGIWLAIRAIADPVRGILRIGHVDADRRIGTVAVVGVVGAAVLQNLPLYPEGYLLFGSCFTERSFTSAGRPRPATPSPQAL